METAKADAESKCSSMGCGLATVLSALAPCTCWPFLLLLGSDDDPVDVSDMEDPDEENIGSDRSEGDGDGGFLPTVATLAPDLKLFTMGDSAQ